MKICVVGSYSIFHSFQSPMEYLRCLLPKGYPHAPPGSPASQMSTKTTASEPGSPSTLAADPSERLSPPILPVDDSELPPYVPDKDDHTSLNQFDPQTPLLDIHQAPRLYHRRLYESPAASIVTRAHSGPTTPIEIKPTDQPRRRRSVPVSYTHLTLPTKRIV